MNWMLVLFMGTSVVKTDVIFATEAECFAYEMKRSSEATSLVNQTVKELTSKGESEDFVMANFKWMHQQFPRGTCIPTTTKPTIKTSGK